jgi:hypothetical protein
MTETCRCSGGVRAQLIKRKVCAKFSGLFLADRPHEAPARALSHGEHLISKERVMKTILLGLVAAAAIGVATPAAAQVWFDVGPFAARIGPPPPWGWRHRPVYREYAYVPADCRIIRERIRRPSGRVIVREREVCD